MSKRIVGLSIFAGRNVVRWTKEKMVCQSLLKGMGSVQQKKDWSINLYWKEHGAMDRIRAGLSVFVGRNRERWTNKGLVSQSLLEGTRSRGQMKG
jgi:hypothetical protein